MASHEDKEEEEATPPKLQLFSSLSSTTLKSSPQIQQTTSKFLHTPPHHALASIPFNWEEEPGKPRPCKTLSLPSSTTNNNNNNDNNNYIKCLELPPRLLNEIKYTNTPSPTTVLDGPYIIGKSIFHSFRLMRSGRHEGGGGGYSNYDGESNCSPERGLLGATSVMGNSGKKLRKGGGSWRKKNGFGIGSKSQKDFFGKGSFVSEEKFDDGLVEDGDSGGPGGGSGGGGSDTRVNVTRISRKKNVLGISQARPHFWAAVYGALKQVIPRRRGSSTKWKN